MYGQLVEGHMIQVNCTWIPTVFWVSYIAFSIMLFRPCSTTTANLQPSWAQKEFHDFSASENCVNYFCCATVPRLNKLCFTPMFSSEEASAETLTKLSVPSFMAARYSDGFWQMQVDGNSWNSPLPGLISSGSPINPLWHNFTFLEKELQSILSRVANRALSLLAFGLIVLLWPMYLLQQVKWDEGFMKIMNFDYSEGNINDQRKQNTTINQLQLGVIFTTFPFDTVLNFVQAWREYLGEYLHWLSGVNENKLKTGAKIDQLSDMCHQNQVKMSHCNQTRVTDGINAHHVRPFNIDSDEKSNDTCLNGQYKKVGRVKHLFHQLPWLVRQQLIFQLQHSFTKWAVTLIFG